MTPSVLITGVSGFAGRHLAAYALERGALVFGQSRGDRFPDAVTGLSAELQDPDAAARVIQRSAPDLVFHLASQTPANTPGAALSSWLAESPVATLNLLEALRAHRPQARVLLVSSSAVYGHVPPAQLPIHEALPLNPATMYGVSKAAQELLALRYHAEQNLHIVRARPFNQLGPGEPHAMLTSTLAKQVAAIVQGAEPIVRMRHRGTSRDYTDIRDTARAYWALLTQGSAGEVYNVCSGIATPIGELTERLLRLAGVTAQIEESAPTLAPGDILAQSGSNAAISQATGWRPEISLDQSLAELLRSFGVQSVA